VEIFDSFGKIVMKVYSIFSIFSSSIDRSKRNIGSLADWLFFCLPRSNGCRKRRLSQRVIKADLAERNPPGVKDVNIQLTENEPIKANAVIKLGMGPLAVKKQVSVEAKC
jgi:hypothetical protein